MNGQDPQPGSQPPEAHPSPAFARLGLRTPPGWTPLPAEQPLPTPVIPDYTLIRRVGGGAYGEVWLARNFTGSFFAIKVVHRCLFDHERPYERELAGIRRFEPISRSHPSQVAIHHVGQNREAGYFYYVMDLADDAAGEGSGADGAKSEVRSPRSEVPRPLSDSRQPESSTGGPCALTPALSRRTGEGARRAGEWSDHRRQVPVPGRQAGLSPRIPAARPPDPATYVPKTLKHLLRTRGRLPLGECLEIASGLVTALEHLHGRGLVHRDIKPSNIIFVGGVPKLADIGLVTSIDATRSFVGTEGFFPPEGPGTPQADIYSLGKLLYEVATGKDRREFPELPTDLASIGEQEALVELNAIILKACQPDPAQRYATAAALRHDLERLEHGRSIRRQRAWQGRWTWLRRTVLPAAAGAAAMVAVAILARSCNEPGAGSRTATGAARANETPGRPAGGTLVKSPGAFVLPFRNEGTNGIADDLRCRITDAFIDALALIKGVPRCPRKSGWAYWDETELRQALARTNVFGQVLTGRLVGEGERVTLTLRLFGSTEVEPMWTESFKGTTSGVVALERKALGRLVGKLGLTVSGDEWTAIERLLQNNLEALRWVREGYAINARHGSRQSSLNESMRCAQEALRLDPLYVDAMRLDHYMFRCLAMKRNPWEVWQNVRRQSEQMLSLDDTFEAALVQLGAAQLVYDRDWAACSRSYARARPNTNPEIIALGSAQFARMFGQFQKARTEQQRLEAGGSAHWEVLGLMALARWVDRQYDPALAILQRARQLYPENPDLVLYSVHCLVAKGDYAEAIAIIQNTPEIRQEVEMVAALACAYARLGETAKAREILEGLLAQTDARAYIEPYFIARVHVALGDKTAALDELEKAAENRSEYLFMADWGGLRTDYHWDALTNETRYWKLCDQLGFGRDQWPRKELIE